MPKVFIDTDVVLDLFIDREPHHSIALHFFSLLQTRRIQGFISPVGIANAYYILSKIRNRSYALEKMRSLRKLVDVASINETMIDASLEKPHIDFEDSIQYRCALSHEIKSLITRNVSNYPKDKLNVLLPDEYMKLSAMKIINGLT